MITKQSLRSSSLDMAEKIQSTDYRLNQTKSEAVMEKIQAELNQKRKDEERDFSKSSNYRFNL